jgi:dsRNA-specific ribonuclease
MTSPMLLGFHYTIKKAEKKIALNLYGVKMSETRGMNRRSFIKQSTLGLIGGIYLSRGVGSPKQVANDTETPRDQRINALKSNLNVP